MRLAPILAASLLIPIGPPLTAADAPGKGNPDWFPFNISALDGSPTAVDLSWMNEKPAGASGFLRAEGARIVDGKGKTVRLFGTNFCFGANFPPEDIAPRIAAHLAKNGINIVRLHHMDSGGKDSLIADNANTKLSAEHLARLDKLIAELIARGIFINLNLHVSRKYPGTPEGAPGKSKGLDHFHPPFIAMFQSYARQLLEHVNPHTGRAYKDEPGIAVIEMNNENSIVLNPWWLSAMPEPFAGELRALFVNHLRGRYASTEDLRAAWGVNDGSAGPNLLKNGDFAGRTKRWQPEAASGAKAGYTPLPDGEKGIRWTSTAKGGLEWSLQFSQSGLALDEKAAYRLSFRARSAQSAKLGVNASNSAPPWNQLGLSERVQLAPEWKEFRFEFAPHNVLPNGRNRVVFSLLNEITSVDLADVRLQAIPTGFLKPDETIEAGNLRIPGRNAGPVVRRDFFDFLIQLEVDHAGEMKRFLREDVGAKQMISHTALIFGGVVGARREFLVSDLVDTHGYWHHPHFTKSMWDMRYWEIDNVSQVAEAIGGTLAELAMQRPFGKPYSVSEYDTPAPNDYAAETFPLFAAMGCLQDWSALYHFAFEHSADFDRDRITGFFNSDGHPAKQAFMPLAALVFRQGLIEPHTTASWLAIDRPAVEEYAARKGGDLWGSWRDLWGKRSKTGALAWQQKTGYLLRDEHAGEDSLPAAAPRNAVEWHPEKPSLAVISAGAALWSGKLGAEAIKLGPITLEPTAPSNPRNATVMIAALDGRPLAESNKLWLSALSRAENPGMVWDADRRSVGTQWGQGPAEVLGVNARFTLPGKADWKVQALDPAGAGKAVLSENATTFEINPAQKTVWWLLTR